MRLPGRRGPASSRGPERSRDGFAGDEQEPSGRSTRRLVPRSAWTTEAAAPGAPSPDVRSLRRRHRRRLAALGLVGVAVLVWVALAGLQLVALRRDALQGNDAARAARQLVQADDLVEGRPVPYLEQAQASFARASRRARHPLVFPLRFLPVVGRQVRSAGALTGAAATAAEVSTEAISGAQQALARGQASGPDRVAVLRDISGVAERAEAGLTGLDFGPEQGLVRQLAEARAELSGNVEGVLDGLHRGRGAAGAAASMLEGPSRYLVLAANNAEMRAGSGMLLNIGELRAGGGLLSLESMRPVTDVAVPAGLPVDPDLAARWGWLQPGSEWRNLMASPRFDVAAPLGAEMWRASGGAPVDGVLVLDPVALRAVLGATGPVSANGRTVSADNVMDELLRQQYIRAGESDEAQGQRREQAGSIAVAAVASLDAGGWSTSRLASELVQAAAGRHLLAWSSRPQEQQGWRDAGIDGALREDSLLVSVLNRGANKLDPFLPVSADLELAQAVDGAAADGAPGNDVGTDVTIRFRLRNETPPGLPRYMAGPNGSELAYGDYAGLLSVNLPAGATGARVEGFDTYAAYGPDGPTGVVAVPVLVPAGQERQLVLQFRMPPQLRAFTLEPDARVPSLNWRHGDQEWSDGGGRHILW